MAFGEGLAERLRGVFAGQMDVVEKKMFGGLAFMVRGSMCVGVTGDELMARVGPDQYDESLALPHARDMDFTGRPMKGFVYIGTDGIESDEELSEWVERSLSFNGTLAAK